MSPSVEQAFLKSVLRYRSLLGAPEQDQTWELWDLERDLGPQDGENSDRRHHRRVAMEVECTARTQEWASPCTVLDVSGGGLSLRNDGGVPCRAGLKFVVSLELDRNGLRIDVPVCVRHIDTVTETVGLEFVGAPLVLNEHLARPRMRPRPRAHTKDLPAFQSTPGLRITKAAA